MVERSLPSKAKSLKLLNWGVLILFVFLVAFFASDRTKGLIAFTFGGIGLPASLLLKLGRIKPGTFWVGNTTPLRSSMMSVGLLGIGIDYLLQAWETRSGQELNMPLVLDVFLLLMILCLFVWAAMEWRAFRRRARGDE